MAVTRQVISETRRKKTKGKKAKVPGRQRIKTAAKRADLIINKGTQVGQNILPEVFPGGSGLDRIKYAPVAAQKVNFEDINQYLTPSVQEAQSFRDDTANRYDELVNLRRAKLGGLDAAENQGLKESLFRDIDRQRAGALRDVNRTQGLGAGGAFAQRRAVGRDYGDASLRANRDLLMQNIDIKRQALGDFENTVGGRQQALGSAGDRISALRGLQATARQSTDQFNTNNQTAADQFNASNQLATDQFNAGQQKAELGARVGAISAGTGMVGDERDAIAAQKQKKKLLDYLAQRDDKLFQQAQALFG